MSDSEHDEDVQPGFENLYRHVPLEKKNTIGKVPIAWYNEYDHIGYNIEGNKIARKSKRDKLDELVERGKPEYWRTVYDEVNDEKIVLTDKELDRQYAHADVDPYLVPPSEYDPKEAMFPVQNLPEPKHRFLPSKHEARMVVKIVRAIRKGWVKPWSVRMQEQQEQDQREIDGLMPHLLWDAAADADALSKNPFHIPAPKLSLPGHAESYNPPEEYLLDAEELKAWEDADPDTRPPLPLKFDCLRRVPQYSKLLQERFERCLDLYLCPRTIKKRMNVDPKDLIPDLPKPSELHPYPQSCTITYVGHTRAIISSSILFNGQLLATGAKDKTVRMWEVNTGRCLSVYKFNEDVAAVAWNPRQVVLAVAVGKETRLLYPLGFVKMELPEQDDVAIHHIPKAATQCPFSKMKGDVQDVRVISYRLNHKQISFHPTKPMFFVATKQYVKVYNLVKQSLVKTLITGVQNTSSIAIHSSGDHVIVGALENRAMWFDLDLSVRPYKALRYHKYANCHSSLFMHRNGVRSVAYSQRYPLFASGSDDGTICVFHGTVYDDLSKNPLIVPVRVLRGIDIPDDGDDRGLGVMDVVFHPSQPWLIASCGDGTARLYVNLG